MHQRGWQQPELEQLLRAIHVGHYPVQHPHALGHTRLNLLPTRGRQNQGEQVHRPRSLRPARIRINVVGDAVVAHLTRHAGGALVHVAQTIGFYVFKKLGPGPGVVRIVPARRTHNRRTRIGRISAASRCAAALFTATQLVKMAGAGVPGQRRGPCVCHRAWRRWGGRHGIGIGGVFHCVRVCQFDGAGPVPRYSVRYILSGSPLAMVCEDLRGCANTCQQLQ